MGRNKHNYNYDLACSCVYGATDIFKGHLVQFPTGLPTITARCFRSLPQRLRPAKHLLKIEYDDLRKSVCFASMEMCTTHSGTLKRMVTIRT